MEVEMNRNLRRRVDLTDDNFEEIMTETNFESVLMMIDHLRDLILKQLNLRDRARLACVSKRCRDATYQPCYWYSLDLRHLKLDAQVAESIAVRCKELQRLRFKGSDSVEWIFKLNATKLIYLSGEVCYKLTGYHLYLLAERHRFLEMLDLGVANCELITSTTVRFVSLFCKNLKKLKLSGIKNVDNLAIYSLAQNCSNLVELGFVDCVRIDENCLGILTSLRFLCLAGSKNVDWNKLSQLRNKLPGLIALDVSRTDINSTVVSQLLSSKSLKVLCAINCVVLEEDQNNVAYNSAEKILLAQFTDVFEGIKKMTGYKDVSAASSSENQPDLLQLKEWVEWVVSFALQRTAKNNAHENAWANFWLQQGTNILLTLMKSSQEDVQEMAADCLGTIMMIENVIHIERVQAVMRGGGIPLLLEMARSCLCEGLQWEVVGAITNLTGYINASKAVGEKGGLDILAGLAFSGSRRVADIGACALWNVCMDIKGGPKSCVKTIVDAIIKWTAAGDEELILTNVVGSLAFLACDKSCTMEVVKVGGVRPLVGLLSENRYKSVKEQAARALSNMYNHDNGGEINGAIANDEGAVKALVKLTSSHSIATMEAAAVTLCSLSTYDMNNIVDAEGVKALVDLANRCRDGPRSLQLAVSGLFRNLSIDDGICFVICIDEGLRPLISFAASSKFSDVQQNAIRALGNIALHPNYATDVVKEGAVNALSIVCYSSDSKVTRFWAAVALAFLMEKTEDVMVSESAIQAFLDSVTDGYELSGAVNAWRPEALLQAAEPIHIQHVETDLYIKTFLNRFVSMLENASPVLRAFAAFALVQFTTPGGRNSRYHAQILQEGGAQRFLNATIQSVTDLTVAKVLSRIVLRNLELPPVATQI